MPKVSEIYSGSYLTGADLQGQTHRLTIERAVVEEVGDERDTKLVVYFAGAKKGLVLNKTNASTLSSVFGDDASTWSGQFVELFTTPVAYGGRTYEGIRVRAASPAPAAAPAPAPAVQASAAPAPAVQSSDAALDDIPF